jgi:hypothetical protein
MVKSAAPAENLAALANVRRSSSANSGDARRLMIRPEFADYAGVFMVTVRRGQSERLPLAVSQGG